jgi:hypothetical protein
MRDEYVRSWTAEEMISFARDPAAMVKLSDELALKIGKILFGRHPGVQLMTIADLGARWVQGHTEEYRQKALDEMKQAIEDLSKSKPPT